MTFDNPDASGSRRRLVESRVRTCGRLAAVALASVAPLGLAFAETADEFVDRLNKQFADIGIELNAAGWTQATYINIDTELLSARANERRGLGTHRRAREGCRQGERTGAESEAPLRRNRRARDCGREPARAGARGAASP